MWVGVWVREWEGGAGGVCWAGVGYFDVGTQSDTQPFAKNIFQSKIKKVVTH
jgi:hypothetical protein